MQRRRTLRRPAVRRVFIAIGTTSPISHHCGRRIAAYDLLTGAGAHSVAPEDVQYYDIFAVASLPRWQDESAPLVRRLHRRDMPAIEAHLLRLDRDDRRLRFFREATDAQILAYLGGFDWNGSLLLGAIRDDRVVGLAEALFDGSGPSHQVEVAVSVDIEFRGPRARPLPGAARR